MASASRDQPNSLVRVLVSIRSSFVLFVMALGILLMVLGYAVTGPMSGILGTIGASAVIYGLLGDLALRAIGYK